MSLNRVVALLTPLVFAPLAGAAAAWIAKHVPGAEVKAADLQEIFIGGALIALAPAAQWLHGWQKYEARQANAALSVELASAAASAPPVAEPEFELDELDELDELLDELDDDLLGDEEPALARGAS